MSVRWSIAYASKGTKSANDLAWSWRSIRFFIQISKCLYFVWNQVSIIRQLPSQFMLIQHGFTFDLATCAVWCSIELLMYLRPNHYIILYSIKSVINIGWTKAQMLVLNASYRMDVRINCNMLHQATRCILCWTWKMQVAPVTPTTTQWAIDIRHNADNSSASFNASVSMCMGSFSRRRYVLMSSN